MPTRRSGRLGGGIAALVIALAAAPAALAGNPAGPAHLDELGSQLLPLRSADQADVREARAGDLAIDGGRVLVDVYVSGDPEAAAERLRATGMDVAATADEPLPVVEGWLPLDSLSPTAKLGLTDAVMPVLGGGTDVGAKTSEGVGAHRIPAAIAAVGTSGAGIDVGVISDSIDQVAGGVNASQASGDLPPDPRVQVLVDDNTDPSDEGRAMAEIVYDEAPGLDRLLFSSGTASGAVGKAASIDGLVANGADVIADDIFYLSEPFFQDGVVSQAVDRAKAAGVPYFASAGNRARQSYESMYSNSGGFHAFSAGNTVQNLVSVPNGAFIQVVLQWDEPWGAAQTNINALLTTTGGGSLPGTVLGGTDSNQATGLPREIVTWSNTSGGPVVAALRIQRVSGTASPFMKYIARRTSGFGPFTIAETPTNSNTINPDAASARGSMAVAAVSASDSGLNTPEGFSSRGPNTRLFDASGNRLATPEVRFNPDLAAADGVSNTVPDFQPAFFGTSASAPSAAGIAAILRSTNRNATVNEIYAQMSDPINAIECTSSALVPDPDCGAGFVLANLAAERLDKTGVAPTATTTPIEPNGKRGWFTKKSVGLTWNTTDPESPTESTSGCEPLTITAQGTTTHTCNATSGGGPGTTSETIKHDSKKPKKPKIKGIEKGETYAAKDLPSKRKVKKCKSKDRTSGLKSCKVKGYSDEPGKHRLKATATDRAGLKAKKSITYRVG